MRAALPLLAALTPALALALAACGSGNGEAAGEAAPSAAGSDAAPSAPATPATTAERVPDVATVPALASRDCTEVVQFYLEAIGARRFGTAALAWQGGTVGAADLEQAFGTYQVPEFTWTEPVIEGAAGSLFCTVEGTLKDAGDARKLPVDGRLVLRRANDVPGATAEQLRWTIRSSTFVRHLEVPGGA